MGFMQILNCDLQFKLTCVYVVLLNLSPSDTTGAICLKFDAVRPFQCMKTGSYCIPLYQDRNSIPATIILTPYNAAYLKNLRRGINGAEVVLPPTSSDAPVPAL